MGKTRRTRSITDKTPIYHRNNCKLIAPLLLRYSGMSASRIVQFLFGTYTNNRWHVIMYRPHDLTIREMHLIYSLLGGRFSLPLLCALAAGYRYDKPIPSWYDHEEGKLPPIPPELEAEELAVIKAVKLKALERAAASPLPAVYPLSASIPPTCSR